MTQYLVDTRDVHLGDAGNGRGDAGVVDQTNHSAKPLDGGFDHSLHVDLGRDIRADKADAQAFFKRVTFCLPARGDNDLGPLLDKYFNNFFANAARPARDNGDFAV
jgi:hypothetical protein